MERFATNKTGNIDSSTEVLANNLTFLQQAKELAISNLYGDLVSEGILNTNDVSTMFQVTANNSGDYAGTFNVGIGIAYKKNTNVSPAIYERIEITDANEIYSNIAPGIDSDYPDGTGPQQVTDDGTGTNVDTPKSTGCKYIPIPNADTVYYIALRYVKVCDNGNAGDGLDLTNYSIAKNLDPNSSAQVKRFYQWINGYEIALVTSYANVNGICLGQVSKNSSNIVTITSVNRTANLLIKGTTLPSTELWGMIGGNIYDQADLWNILLKGLSWDSTTSIDIGGYPKDTILRFYELDGSYLIKALIDNPDEPTISNIQYRNYEEDKHWKCIEFVPIKIYSNVGNWYKLYSNRWCEQGGRATIPANTTQIVTLLLPFEDTNYYSSANGGLSLSENYSDWAWINGGNPYSASQIKIQNFYDYSREVQWEAKGFVQGVYNEMLLNATNLFNGSAIVEQIGSDIAIAANDNVRIEMGGGGSKDTNYFGGGGGYLLCYHTFTEATTLRVKKIKGQANERGIGIVIFTFDGVNETPILAVGGTSTRLQGFSWCGGSGYNGGIGASGNGYSFDGNVGNSEIKEEGACGAFKGPNQYGGSGYVAEGYDALTIYGSPTQGNLERAFVIISKLSS